MTPEDPTTDLRIIWQQQERREPPVTLDQVRARARRVEAKVDRRNLLEYVAGVVALLIVTGVGMSGGAALWSGPRLLVSVGLILLLLGLAYVLYQLHTRGSWRAMPGELGTTDSVAFHRAELVRQRDLLKSVWSWYILPMYPGMALMAIGVLISDPSIATFVALVLVLAAVMSYAVARANAQGAKVVQRQIDELEADPAKAFALEPATDHLQHWSIWLLKSFFYAFVGGLAAGRHIVPLVPGLDTLSRPVAALVVVFTLMGIGVLLHAAWWLSRRKK